MCLLQKAEFLIFVSHKSSLCTEIQSLNSFFQFLRSAALGLDLDTLNPFGTNKGTRGLNKMVAERGSTQALLKVFF